jgi:hypothetical protein
MKKTAQWALAKAMSEHVNGWQWFPEDSEEVAGVLKALQSLGFDVLPISKKPAGAHPLRAQEGAR